MNFRKKIIIFFIVILVMLTNLSHGKELNSKEEIILAEEINEIVPNDEIQENQGMQIYSDSVILMEQKTGKVLFEKNMNERRYPASTTKILTAIIAIEKCDLNEIATASEQAVNAIKSGYTIANIQPGESFTIEQLLDVLMLQSANEAANVIAEHISGSTSEFAKLMNEKAKEIGCMNTNFVNANGAHNENHYSTAYDMALIARYCMKNETFRKFANKMECSLPMTEIWQQKIDELKEKGKDEEPNRSFKNTNKLLIPDNMYYYPYCTGMKTGFTTPAKNCLIASSNKNNFETIVVVLHAEATEEGLSARYLDTINLFEYAYNNFNIENILEEYDMIEHKVEELNQNLVIGSTNNDSNDDNKKDIIFNQESIKIGIGILIVIIAFIIITRRKGKHTYKKNAYYMEN